MERNSSKHHPTLVKVTGLREPKVLRFERLETLKLRARIVLSAKTKFFLHF